MKLFKFFLPSNQKVQLDDTRHVEGPCVAVVIAESFEQAKRLLAAESPTPYMTGWLDNQKTIVTVFDLATPVSSVVTVFM